MAHSARIHLTGLKLTNFRNYSALQLECDQRHVVLTGENGSGKTNILEAVSCLSPGRGLRRASREDIAKNDGNGTWAVFAELEGSNGPASIGTGIQETALGPDRQRRVRVNGVQSKSSDGLL
ncbi:MAG: AAA family ATPase, partial [Rhizobiaceae bacterium]